MKKCWKKTKCDSNNRDIIQFAKQLGVSPITAAILHLKGIISVDEAKRFINPQLTDMYSPCLLKDMDKATQRIKSAITKNEKIMIYGDYDVDGINSVTVLIQALREMKAQVSYYLPNRFIDGYGISMTGIEEAHNQGVSLIITVDCGISAILEIERANHLGIDVIITDHHEVKSDIPRALAIINPKQQDCPYPNKNLSGVGVAMKLACKILEQPYPADSFIELACLGTIADVLPIIGENRIIVSHGLKLLSETKNIGLKALIKVSDISNRKITTGDIGFKLAPRLNAAGRIEDANLALRLLLTSSPQDAQQIAEELNKKNIQRQHLQNEIFEQAKKGIVIDDSMPVIVVAGEEWHSGVIGIVASKIVDAYHRPTVVISYADRNGIGKGSCRSIPGFNILKALTQCEDLLDTYGGHHQAAGLTISVDKIDRFRQQINDYACEILTQDALIPSLDVMEIGLDEISILATSEIENLLAPFGICNSRPVFLSSGLKLCSQPRIVGSNHLKIKLKDKRMIFDAIGFNLGKAIEDLNVNPDRIEAVYVPEINNWQGSDMVQLNLKDIKNI